MILAYCNAVPDLNQISVSRSQGQVFERGRRLLDPSGERAVELALQRRAEEEPVVALAIGDEADADALRKPLAMGADRAILITGAEPFDDFVRANLIHAAARRLEAKTIFFGNPELAARMGVLSVDAQVAPPDVQPRKPGAPAIMKAARKPVERMEAAGLGLAPDDLKARLVRRAAYLAES